MNHLTFARLQYEHLIYIYMIPMKIPLNHTVDGRNPAPVEVKVVYPIISNVLYISGGFLAGFLKQQQCHFEFFVVLGAGWPVLRASWVRSMQVTAHFVGMFGSETRVQGPKVCIIILYHFIIVFTRTMERKMGATVDGRNPAITS